MANALGSIVYPSRVTARTGRGQFYIMESIKTHRVHGRVQMVVLFEPYESVTISLSLERARQVIDALERAVTEG